MSLEILGAVVVLTVFRLAWILKRPVHKDITFYILPGLSNLSKIFRYDPDFSYVPYGLIWYAINVPIVRAVRYSGRLWITVLALIDIVFLYYTNEFLGFTVFLAYVFIGTFQLLRAPWNASINWLIVLAPISWIFLLLAPIAKFPVGLPVQVWRYTERAVGHQHNYIYFGLLGTLWLIVFNHLYFLPALESLIVVGLGIVWCCIFGYAYLERRAKRQKSTTKPLE
ncbi:MAG TPA: hypothetical protein VNW25_03370 [Candidatus Sulfotelmatobacter sp.]|jgi:hypothetical protein|nr:hypothetical protein [Candidatus Sulfotelmatobacter sp.]